MTNPITPPPELLDKWNNLPLSTQEIFVIVAQWGADQELAACTKWIEDCGYHPSVPKDLFAARRPKSQTLNSIALEMLGTIEKMDVVVPEITDTIRRALKELTK